MKPSNTPTADPTDTARIENVHPLLRSLVLTLLYRELLPLNQQELSISEWDAPATVVRIEITKTGVIPKRTSTYTKGPVYKACYYPSNALPPITSSSAGMSP